MQGSHGAARRIARPHIPLAFLAATASVALPQAQPVFEAVQPDLFAAGGSLTNAWADYDGDGDIDLFVGFNGAANRLYRNDAGTFVDVAPMVGLADARPTRAAAWGDYDGDGDPDLLAGFTPGEGGVLRLYRNDNGRFTDVTVERGLSVDSGTVRQPVWVDVDGDNDLDLFVAFRDRANALYENVSGEFTDIAGLVGLADPRRTVGAVWFDFDEDGDLDLYTGNMDGDANALFRNDNGMFTDVAEALGVQWGGRAPGDPASGTVRPCAADIDNDGRFDLYTANYGPNGLFLNRGGEFEDASVAWGVAVDSHYDSCALADIDNDGRLDVFVNGTITGGVAYPDHLYRNRGGALEEVTPEILRRLDGDHGVQWADWNADGAVDLALTSAPADGHHALLRNGLPREAATKGVNLIADDDAGRTIPPGSEIRLFSTSGALIGARLVDSGSGYDSQSVAPVHFGLGDISTVDVEVTVVNGGQRNLWRLRGLDLSSVRGRTVVLRLAPGGSIERVRPPGRGGSAGDGN